MASDDHLDPARRIIDRLGGVEAVARITNRDVSRVYRWMYTRERGGTDGRIPQPEAEKLLAHARANGIRLTPADFFPRPEAAVS